MSREQLREEEKEQGEKKGKEDEQQKLQSADGNKTESEKEQYAAVVASMADILSVSPIFEPSETLSPETTKALEALYAAKTAVREEVGDGHVSGIARMKALNLALANLRPVLSVGMEPGKDDGVREVIGEQVAELRHEIKQAIGKEAVPKQKRKKKEEEEDAGDEDEPEDDDK